MDPLSCLHQGTVCINEGSERSLLCGMIHLMHNRMLLTSLVVTRPSDISRLGQENLTEKNDSLHFFAMAVRRNRCLPLALLTLLAFLGVPAFVGGRVLSWNSTMKPPSKANRKRHRTWCWCCLEKTCLDFFWNRASCDRKSGSGALVPRTWCIRSSKRLSILRIMGIASHHGL